MASSLYVSLDVLRSCFEVYSKGVWTHLYHQTQSCAALQSLGMIHNVLSGLTCCFVCSLDLKIQFSLYGCARRPLLGYTFVQLGNILHEVN